MIVTPHDATEQIQLRKSEVWKASYRGVTIEIQRWAFDSTAGLRPWKENWNYYIYMYESKCADFEKLWLPDEIKRFSEESDPYITHDYYSGAVGEIEMHGGITYYAKHGQSVGHRCIQVGCDYQHLCDEGQTYSVEKILRDAKASADQCAEMFYKPEEVPV